MLTLHVGLPKTATTAAQRVLTKAAPDLSERGIDYLDILRNREGIAHHLLPAELLERRAADGPSASALMAHMRETKARHTIVSSEAFTNVIVGPRRETFLKFVEALAQSSPVRVVLVLRRVDDFFTSMYLQSAKVGELRGPFETYVASRRSWSAALFQGLRAIRRSGSVEQLVVIKYQRGPNFLRRLLSFILDDEAATEVCKFGGSRASKRLTVKGHALLLGLDEMTERIGMPLERFPLIRALEMGRLKFDDDLKDFDLIDKDAALSLHCAAIDAAEAAGEKHYKRYFGGDPMPEGPVVKLETNLLTPADQDALAAYASWMRNRRRPAARALP